MGEENVQPSPDAQNGDEQDESLLSIYMILEHGIILTIIKGIF